MVTGCRPMIAGIGVAAPPPVEQELLWDGFFSRHYAGPSLPLARRIFANSGVRTRQAAVNPLLEDVSGWSTDRRMRRYLAEALPLGREAVERALKDAGLTADEIGLFVVCSCTGYVTPGLDILLARDLCMSSGVQRLFVGHMGCYAAIPGLGAASDFVAARGRPALLLCAEVTSLHAQPASSDSQQMVAHALFSDAAAAAVLVPGEPGGRVGPGYAVHDVVAATDTSTADHMTWNVTDLGFRMGLSAQVPDVLSRHVGDLVGGLLGRYGLSREEVAGWAVHPGGPRILTVVQRQVALPPEALAASRDVLARFGNCSSPTVLLVLDELTRRGDRPDWVVMLAFGPGLTLYAALLGATSG